MKSDHTSEKHDFPARTITAKDRQVFAGAERLMRTDRLFTDPRLSLASMAAQLGVNRETLSRAVNLLAGASFIVYLNSYRIQEAKKLLEQRLFMKNATKISAECGFGTPTSFYRTFKKVVGVSPGEYADHLKQQQIKNR